MDLLHEKSDIILALGQLGLDSHSCFDLILLSYKNVV